MAQTMKVGILVEVLDRATAPFRRIAGAVQSIQAPLQRVSQSLSTASQKIGMIGAGMMASGYGIKEAFNAAIGPGADFQAAISSLAAHSGVAADKIGILRRKALEIGRDDPTFSASQAAAAMEELGKQGMDLGQILAAIVPTMDLAGTENMELAQAAKITSQALHQFGLDASEARRVVDVLTVASNASATSAAEIGVALSYAGVNAKKAGQSIEQTAANMAALSNLGLEGSRMGTTLASMYTRLAAPTKKAADALRFLGVSVKDNKGNLRDFGAILAEIDKSMARMHLGSARVQEILFEVFGLEHIAGAGGLAERFGSGEVGAILDKIKASAGAAAAARKIMNDNWNADKAGLAGSVDALRIGLFDAVQEDLRKSTQGLTGWVNGITAWVEANQPLVRSLLLVASALGTVMIAAGGLALVLAGLGMTLSVLLSPVVLAGGAIAAIACWDDLTGLWEKVPDALEPIGTALGGLWRAMVPESIRTMVSDVWTNLKTSVISTWESLRSGFTSWSGGIASGQTSLWDRIKTGAVSLWERLKAGFGDLATRFGLSTDTLKAYGTQALDAITDGLGRVHDYVPSLDQVVGALESIGKFGTGFGSGFWDGLKVAGPGLKALADAFGLLKSPMADVSKLGNQIGYVLGLIIGVPIRILSQFVADLVTAVRAFKDAWDGVLGVVQAVADIVGRIKLPSLPTLFGESALVYDGAPRRTPADAGGPSSALVAPRPGVAVPGTAAAKPPQGGQFTHRMIVEDNRTRIEPDPGSRDYFNWSGSGAVMAGP